MMRGRPRPCAHAPGGLHALAHALADDVSLHLREGGLDLQKGPARRRGGAHGRVDRSEFDAALVELANAYLDNGWKQSERSEFGNRIRGIESKGRAAVRAEKRKRTFEPLDETIGRLGRVWSLLIAWLEMFAKLYPEAGEEVAGVTRRVDRCLSVIDEVSEKYGASPELIEHVQRTRAEARQLGAKLQKQ